MELKKGYTYIAFLKDNPLKSFKFEVLKQEDLFLEISVVEGINNVEFWKSYVVRLTSEELKEEYLEIAPYDLNERTKTLKSLIIGKLIERRKFVRFNVLELNIPIESEFFKGKIENISLGGLKILIEEWKNRELKKNEPVYVKATVDNRDFHFLIVPVHIEEGFISAKFEKPVRVTSELFYQCLKKLQKEYAPVSEKRKFRRIFVRPLNIIADTPLGAGYLVDISLKGMKIEIKQPKQVDEEVLLGTFPVVCYIPQRKEEYTLETRLVNKTKDGFLSLEITNWGDENFKLVSSILEELYLNPPFVVL